jgi:large subunit ribosomal protein L25
MDRNVLEANERTVIGKQVRGLRGRGRLPAVMYGKGTEPKPLDLDSVEVSKVLARSGAATLIDLQVNGETHTVLIRDVQRNPIKRDLLHVDFLKVDMDVAITTQVPVELVGQAPAVQELGGILFTGMTEIEVEALPSDLPDRVVVELDGLTEIEDAITVGDLFLGKGVTVLIDPDEVIAKVIYQEEEILEEEEEEEEIFLEGEEPEVIEKGKREEEEEFEGEVEEEEEGE